MNEVSRTTHADGTPVGGRGSGLERIAEPNPVLDRLRHAKREAVESALGKGESWCKKVIAGDSGVLVEDLPQLCAFLGLKLVSADKRCVDPAVFDAVMAIHEKLAPQIRKLVWEESE
jgi:hypothetical protein